MFESESNERIVANIVPTPTTSAVRNTVGKGNDQNLDRPAFDVALREYRDKYYHQLLPIIAEKVHQEKVQQEKLKEVKARLNFGGCSEHSKSRTPNVRKRYGKGRRFERSRSMSGSPEHTSGFSRINEVGQGLPGIGRKTEKERNPFPESITKNIRESHQSSSRVKIAEEDTRNQDRKKSSIEEDDLSQPDDPEDHLKLFQATAKVERWAMPTWYHMFNSTLTRSARELKQAKDQPKTTEKGETFGKDKALAILKVARQKITQSFSPDSEIPFPPLGNEDETKGPMIIESEIEGHFIHRMYVDGESASEILYEHCFNRLRPKVKRQMVSATVPIVSFSGETIWPMGQISLLVKIVLGGVLTLRSNRIVPLECAMVSGPEVQPSNAIQIAEEKIKVAIHLEYPEQTIAIGSTLTAEGVSRHIAEHRLNVRKGCSLVRQKERGQAPKRNKAIQEEVEKLVDAGIMKEGGKEMPIYFVSRVLQGLEVNYTLMEKLVLALVYASKRLERYFQEAHTIIVMTDQPIKQILSKPEIVGRMQKSSIELGEYDIQQDTTGQQCMRCKKNDKGMSRLSGSSPCAKEPATKANLILFLWPFYKWGIDIARPFLEGPGKVKFLIVAIDYFTKWIKAKHVATITNNLIKKFVWDNIVCRFGLPGEIISDNGKQFRDNPFRTKAVIPAKIGMPTLKTVERDITQNYEALEINLDLLEERREQATIREARSKEKMKKYYNSKVRNTSFKPGDLVYRNNDDNHAKDNGKLSPKREGPYEVTEAVGKWAYKLKDRNGKLLSRTWNICNLQKCYVHAM
nr:reverse transcriptase domain-containing protein [Tanacetum cinerariifolium]